MVPSIHVLCIVLLLTWVAMPNAQAQLDHTSDTTVKAVFLYNFVKFTDWKPFGPAESVTVCVIGDTRMAAVLVETVRGQRVEGHPLEIEAIGGDASLRPCHVLFISKSETGRSAAVSDGLKRLPILTVSDSVGFAQSNGIIEFYVDSGRMRFAINTDAAARAGLRLSAKLLVLARIVHDGQGS
jgi:YfiR/HmsC-like